MWVKNTMYPSLTWFHTCTAASIIFSARVRLRAAEYGLHEGFFFISTDTCGSADLSHISSMEIKNVWSLKDLPSKYHIPSKHGA